MFFIKSRYPIHRYMKKTNLLHNPTAGDNDFSKKELVKLIKKKVSNVPILGEGRWLGRI
jgi:diacylglycerol kinase (ATP)